MRVKELIGKLVAKEREPMFRLFGELVKPSTHSTLLDIGGPTKGLPEVFAGVTSVNIKGADIIGDARCLPFGDKSFDYVFSNATLEHIPKEDWPRVASEVMRVAGKGFFIATPNYHFPLEPHYLIPYAQLLPRFIKRHLPHIWSSQDYSVDINLPRKAELQSLFPDATVVGWGRIIPRHLIAWQKKGGKKRC